MTVCGDLVSAAVVRSKRPDGDRVRTLTLANLAAACGYLGDASTVLEAEAAGAGSPGASAYRLGILLHARTQDDFFPRGRCHPGAVALAAVLGLGERVGDRLLQSLALGYRVTGLVSAAYAREAQRRGLRPSGAFGALGGAAAAAAAIGLDGDRIAAAVAFAAAHSGGTNQAWISGSQEWLTQVGVASRLSVEAALMAEAGVRSAPDALEGRSGWAAAFFGDGGAASLREELDSGRNGDLIAEVATKPYPISGIAQVPTDLAVGAHGRLAGRSEPSEIRSAVIRMNPAEASYPGTDTTGPVTTRAAALMSVRHCVACGLLDGKVGLRRLEAPDDELDRLAKLIAVEPDPGLEETEAMLEVRAGDSVIECAGHGSKVLYPSWDDLGSDTEGLARRSEAPIEVVERLRSEIVAAAPDAVRLRLTIEEVV